jgi:hypothetical protein
VKCRPVLEAAAAESRRGCAESAAAKPASVERGPAAAKTPAMKATTTPKSTTAMTAVLNLGRECIAGVFRSGGHGWIAQRQRLRDRRKRKHHARCGSDAERAGHDFLD